MAFPDCAGATAVSEVRRDQVQLVKRLSEKFCRLGGHKAVARAVESVAPHFVLLVQIVRDGVQVGAGAHRLMKCRVENRDMRHIRELLHCSLNSYQIGRVMKRSQFAAIFDPLDALRADLHAVLESLSSMDHAVTDSHNFQVSHLVQDFVEHLQMPGARQGNLVALPVEKFRFQTRFGRAQPLGEPLNSRFAGAGVDDRKFQRRTPAIDDENEGHG